MFSNKVSP